MSLCPTLLMEFDEEFSNTRKFLELIPDDKLMWKPHDKSMELGRLAWHLADFPGWSQGTFQQDVFSMTAEDGERMMHDWKGKTRKDILAKFDATMAGARSALQHATEADLNSHWKMEYAGQVIVDSPRAWVVRKWVLNHMIHHRAQFGVYLRLLGIAIPGVYGPSADENAG